jgi:hypothetical protein
MTRKLVLLLLLALPALAQDRQPYPDDYKPSPCANAAPVCKTFAQSQFADVAAKRGFDLGAEWTIAHWQELSEALAPACAKIATCFATPGNTFTFCNDVVADEVNETVCDRYAAGSEDRTKCDFFVRIYMVGHDRNSRKPWEKLQECAKAQPASTAERTFEWWMVPEKIGPDYAGKFMVYAIDSETQVPVRARVKLDVPEVIYAPESVDGQTTAYSAFPWKAKLVRVPNAQGHRDVVPPTMHIEAPGYRTVSHQLVMDVPAMNVKMEPEPSKLKRGRNTVTITATDAATGTPIEARVMAGATTVLGKTNVPFELEIVKGRKRPEIWVTSLYDRYSDVVVAPAE